MHRRWFREYPLRPRLCQRNLRQRRFVRTPPERWLRPTKASLPGSALDSPFQFGGWDRVHHPAEFENTRGLTANSDLLRGQIHRRHNLVIRQPGRVVQATNLFGAFAFKQAHAAAVLGRKS